MAKIKKDTQKKDTPKQKYQVLNWSVYNNALRNRGDITLYFSEDVLENWYSDLPNQKGAQFVYSDLCIETALMIKCLFKLPYRQLEGFMISLLKLVRLEDLRVPAYTQICRRVRTLRPTPFTIPKSGPITIAIDSTGIKVYGEGEWKVRKHGASKRRTWRKLHLGVHPETGYIHCHALTLNSSDDGSQLEGLVNQVKAPIKRAILDGAYDLVSCWGSLLDKGISPVIPIRKNAVEWFLEQPGDYPEHPRNIIIQRIEQTNRETWKKESGYHQRSLSETAMFRYKTIHGATFFSRSYEKQCIENDIKIKMLNIMTAQGMPVSKPKVGA